MFCHRCGKPLLPESSFCKNCGAKVIKDNSLKVESAYSFISTSLTTDSSQSPRHSPQNNESNEEIIFRIRPSFYSVGTTYLRAALLSLLSIALFGYFGLPIGISLALSLGWFLIPLIRHFQRNRISYTLTPTKIEIDFGIIAKTVRNIPLHNAQDVTVSAGVFERIIGVGNIIIDSAADTGKIQMCQIPQPQKHANLILQQLQKIQHLQ